MFEPIVSSSTMRIFLGHCFYFFSFPLQLWYCKFSVDKTPYKILIFNGNTIDVIHCSRWKEVERKSYQQKTVHNMKLAHLRHNCKITSSHNLLMIQRLHARSKRKSQAKIANEWSLNLWRIIFFLLHFFYTTKK